MHPARPPTISSPPRWRASLPAALVVTGIALSCSTACLTSAIIQSANASAAAAHREAGEQRERDDIVRALTAVLPLPSAGVPAADRLSVTGKNHVYVVAAVGEFSPQNATALADAARQLYVQTVPFNARFELRAYREVDRSRTLVAEFTVDLAAEVAADLRRVLPPAGSRTPEADRLRVNASGDGKILYVNALGEFTPEATRAFIDAVRKLRSRLPPSQRVLAWARLEADGTPGRRVVGHFDSDAPGENPP